MATRNQNIVNGVYKTLDVVAFLLLLSGQVRIGGVFVSSGGFSLSLSGTVTGGGVEGKLPNAALVLDVLDIIAALLILTGQLQVLGTYITSGRFSIVVGGPILGGAKMESYLPRTNEFIGDYKRLVWKSVQGQNWAEKNFT